MQLSAGFSSLERFLVNLSVAAAQLPAAAARSVRAAVNYSSYSKSIELGFTEPYLFDRNIAIGFDIFRRDLNSFNFFGNDRTTTYEQTTTGGQIRMGVPLTEKLSLALRYGANYDEISLNENVYFSDPDGTGPLPVACDPLIAGRYLCDVLGNRLTSSIGASLVCDTLNNRHSPELGRAVRAQHRFCRPRRRRALSARAHQRRQILERLRRLHLLADGRGAAISTASRTARPTSIRSG